MPAWRAARTPGAGSRKPHDVLPHGVVLFASLGFSAVEVLAAATSVAARPAGSAAGRRLAPGFDADILAVAGDPTTDVRALFEVRAVCRAGRRVSRAADARADLPGGIRRLTPPDTP